MKTIWKYELKPDGHVWLPLGAEVLHAASQGAQIYIWALVESDLAANQLREFLVYGTGHEVKPSVNYALDFIGTVLMMNGSLVFHVFEKIPVGSVH